MSKQIIDLLTSYEVPDERCEMGNIAIARGAVEAGVAGVFAYPGTPSTEISEAFHHINDFQLKTENLTKHPEITDNKIYFEFSINEKIALEKAIAYSIAGKRTLCVMKNVGMNVASDALMSITYQTIGAALVIILCDDPGCFSSSNEQDSRYWGKFASVPVFNPSSPQEALEMTRAAFNLSAEICLPVIVRTTVRVNHSRGVVQFGKIFNSDSEAKFAFRSEYINIPARNANAHHILLDKLKSAYFDEVYSKFVTQKYEVTVQKKGIITSGVPYSYITELLSRNVETSKIPVLKIGVTFPFPEKEVLQFLRSGVEEVLVIEELDSIEEDEARIIAQKNKLTIDIFGKGYSGLSKTGEYTLDILKPVLEFFTETLLDRKGVVPIENAFAGSELLPPRPPALCAGCPHRATFYALKLSVPRGDGKIILCGDIGCFGLGALAPLQMIDTINHMGMSISMAQGLSAALQIKPGEGKTVALLGDGTFFHSGVASLLNAVYTRANILVIIFDNRTIGMTGHQEHPGAAKSAKYKQIDIAEFVKGLGVSYIENIDPYNLKESTTKILTAVATDGVSVLVSKSPCIFLPEFKQGSFARREIRVNPDKCNTCFNHCDSGISCSKVQTAGNNLVRAKAKIKATNHVYGMEQLCPANICNHGFFNSILAGNYKEALEIVRDKMVFANVCGDICHKPCESLFRQSDGKSIPIKLLKHFVSNIEENFNDFSSQINIAKNAPSKNKKVGVIGAGPAGLSVAYDLIRNGYEVVVYEREAIPGGMIRLIIPGFRMDKPAMDKEMGVLAEMGVIFKFNTHIGRDITMDELLSGHDALVVATGLWQSNQLEIVEKNVSRERKFNAVEFLKSYNAGTLQLTKDAKILVIGGGNSAMDVARAAKKLSSGNQVTVSCIEQLQKMTAFPEEIVDAIQEGIQIADNSFAGVVLEHDGQVDVALYNFEDKKYISTIQADYVITAIGQQGETGILNEIFETNNTGRITGATKHKHVFYAGDVAAGNHISLIGAIGSGKKAATNVRQFLENYPYDYEGSKALNKLAESINNGNNLTAEPELLIHDEDALDMEEILDLDLFQPCGKCDHCIENFGCPAMVKKDGKIVIDEKRCTRCGLCIDVCPNGAIEWVTEPVGEQ